MIRIVRDYIKDHLSFKLVFSLKNEGVITIYFQNNIYDVTWPEVRRKSSETATRCLPTVGNYSSLYMKSLAQ